MSLYTNRPLTEEEWQAVKDTLDILQESQNLVDTARQRLSIVPGFSDEWSTLANAHQAVKDGWYLVDGRRVAVQQAEQNRSSNN